MHLILSAPNEMVLYSKDGVTKKNAKINPGFAISINDAMPDVEIITFPYDSYNVGVVQEVSVGQNCANFGFHCRSYIPAPTCFERDKYSQSLLQTTCQSYGTDALGRLWGTSNAAWDDFGQSAGSTYLASVGYDPCYNYNNALVVGYCDLTTAFNSSNNPPTGYTWVTPGGRLQKVYTQDQINNYKAMTMYSTPTNPENALLVTARPNYKDPVAAWNEQQDWIIGQRAGALHYWALGKYKNVCERQSKYSTTVLGLSSALVPQYWSGGAVPGGVYLYIASPYGVVEGDMFYNAQYQKFLANQPVADYYHPFGFFCQRCNQGFGDSSNNPDVNGLCYSQTGTVLNGATYINITQIRAQNPNMKNPSIVFTQKSPNVQSWHVCTDYDEYMGSRAATVNYVGEDLPYVFTENDVLGAPSTDGFEVPSSTTVKIAFVECAKLNGANCLSQPYCRKSIDLNRPIGPSTLRPADGCAAISANFGCVNATTLDSCISITAGDYGVPVCSWVKATGLCREYIPIYDDAELLESGTSILPPISVNCAIRPNDAPDLCSHDLRCFLVSVVSSSSSEDTTSICNSWNYLTGVELYLINQTQSSIDQNVDSLLSSAFSTINDYAGYQSGGGYSAVNTSSQATVILNALGISVSTAQYCMLASINCNFLPEQLAVINPTLYNSALLGLKRFHYISRLVTPPSLVPECGSFDYPPNNGIICQVKIQMLATSQYLDDPDIVASLGPALGGGLISSCYVNANNICSANCRSYATDLQKCITAPNQACLISQAEGICFNYFEFSSFCPAFAYNPTDQYSPCVGRDNICAFYQAQSYLYNGSLITSTTAPLTGGISTAQLLQSECISLLGFSTGNPYQAIPSGSRLSQLISVPLPPPSWGTKRCVSVQTLDNFPFGQNFSCLPAELWLVLNGEVGSESDSPFLDIQNSLARDGCFYQTVEDCLMASDPNTNQPICVWYETQQTTMSGCTTSSKLAYLQSQYGTRLNAYTRSSYRKANTQVSVVVEGTIVEFGILGLDPTTANFYIPSGQDTTSTLYSMSQHKTVMMTPPIFPCPTFSELGISLYNNGSMCCVEPTCSNPLFVFENPYSPRWLLQKWMNQVCSSEGVTTTWVKKTNSLLPFACKRQKSFSPTVYSAGLLPDVLEQIGGPNPDPSQFDLNKWNDCRLFSHPKNFNTLFALATPLQVPTVDITIPNITTPDGGGVLEGAVPLQILDPSSPMAPSGVYYMQSDTVSRQFTGTFSIQWMWTNWQIDTVTSINSVPQEFPTRAPFTIANLSSPDAYQILLNPGNTSLGSGWKVFDLIMLPLEDEANNLMEIRTTSNDGLYGSAQYWFTRGPTGAVPDRQIDVTTPNGEAATKIDEVNSAVISKRTAPVYRVERVVRTFSANIIAKLPNGDKVTLNPTNIQVTIDDEANSASFKEGDLFMHYSTGKTVYAGFGSDLEAGVQGSRAYIYTQDPLNPVDPATYFKSIVYYNPINLKGVGELSSSIPQGACNSPNSPSCICGDALGGGTSSQVYGSAELTSDGEQLDGQVVWLYQVLSVVRMEERFIEDYTYSSYAASNGSISLWDLWINSRINNLPNGISDLVTIVQTFIDYFELVQCSLLLTNYFPAWLNGGDYMGYLFDAFVTVNPLIGYTINTAELLLEFQSVYENGRTYACGNCALLKASQQSINQAVINGGDGLFANGTSGVYNNYTINYQTSSVCDPLLGTDDPNEAPSELRGSYLIDSIRVNNNRICYQTNYWAVNYYPNYTETDQQTMTLDLGNSFGQITATFTVPISGKLIGVVAPSLHPFMVGQDITGVGSSNTARVNFTNPYPWSLSFWAKLRYNVTGNEDLDEPLFQTDPALLGGGFQNTDSLLSIGPNTTEVFLLLVSPGDFAFQFFTLEGGYSNEGLYDNETIVTNLTAAFTPILYGSRNYASFFLDQNSRTFQAESNLINSILSNAQKLDTSILASLGSFNVSMQRIVLDLLDTKLNLGFQIGDLVENLQNVTERIQNLNLTETNLIERFVNQTQVIDQIKTNFTTISDIVELIKNETAVNLEIIEDLKNQTEQSNNLLENKTQQLLIDNTLLQNEYKAMSAQVATLIAQAKATLALVNGLPPALNDLHLFQEGEVGQSIFAEMDLMRILVIIAIVLAIVGIIALAVYYFVNKKKAKAAKGVANSAYKTVGNTYNSGGGGRNPSLAEAGLAIGGAYVSNNYGNGGNGGGNYSTNSNFYPQQPQQPQQQYQQNQQNQQQQYQQYQQSQQQQQQQSRQSKYNNTY